ncbi:MAG: metallophosphoesterase [Pyrinomonadaceae bacterium]|nr:metallophosphoesterase [Pyrinomonadaceae bacterium]
MKDASPIVSFQQINNAFSHESVMTRTHNEADAKTDDPIEAASKLAALGNALKVLETADAEARSKVLVAADHRVASLLQTYLAMKSSEEGKVEASAAGANEAKFDDKDVLGWIGSFFSWWKRLKPAKWLAAPPEPETIPNNPEDFRMAVLGDWGTGLYGAPLCAKSIEAEKNIAQDDKGYGVLMHLGDVYYSGDDHEVQKRFLDLWPKNPNTVSRAINANHEMYTGGHAYFKKILKGFKQPASYFALQNDHWLLVGLDSAYADKDLAKDQVGWLNNIIAKADKRKIIMFTHHQPFSWLEEQHPKMTGKLGQLLNSKKIFAWYWGHEHRCVIYDQHDAWGLHGRCVGHGGYPYFRKNWSELGAKKEDENWWQLGKKNFTPGGRVLDGSNQYIDGHDDPQRYGPQGYMTVEFRGKNLNEIVHAPDGTKLYEKQIA